MHAHRRIHRRVLFFVAVLLMLLVMEPAALELLGGGLALLLVLCLTALVGLAVNQISARFLNTAARDDLASEESVRNERLHTLRNQAEQMEQTLRDLRDLRLPEAETTRARWAEIDLEEALGRTREQICGEQAALALLHTTRWLQQLEPLLRSLEELSPCELRHWTGRLVSIRAQAVELRSRTALCPELTGVADAETALRLLDDGVCEVDALRAELLTRQAELLARSAPRPERSNAPVPDAHTRLRALLDEARARREVRSWAP